MRIAFFSTMRAMPWGGSEELWSRAALELLDRGHEVHAWFFPRKGTPAPVTRLTEAGVRFYTPRGLRASQKGQRILQRLGVEPSPGSAWLKKTRPDSVVFSAGLHSDDLRVAITCKQLGIPYAILVQAACPFKWGRARDFESSREAYAGADRLFFVSDQNRRVVESHFALDLSRAEIVDNPFNLPDGAEPSWPGDGEPWKLAFLGRLQFLSKGQDVVLEVLRQEKWRRRALEVTFFGEDQGSGDLMRRIIETHGLERQAKLGGFSKDLVDLWSRHHGLLLTSRYEGNPLAMIEAMRCGRAPIVTDVGRASELIDDGHSGFLAEAATAGLVDAAMERAWARRHDWRTIGQAAAAALPERHSLRPAFDFAERLLEGAAAQRVQRAA